LEGATKQPCKTYGHVLFVSSYHIPNHEVLMF
jgi:hypothetical protein